MKPLRMLALAGLPLMLAAPAAAQELKIGVASEPTSIDPHFHNVGPNNSLRRHIFEVARRDRTRRRSSCPSSRPPGAPSTTTTWEFKLRPGVKFSNGTDFTREGRDLHLLPHADGRELALALHRLHPRLRRRSRRRTR